MTVHSAAVVPRPKGASLPWRLAAVSASVANAFERSTPFTRVTSLEWAVLAMLVCLSAVLRFWGLGGHGLEYDEETMAMPVMHIIEHGTPAMPSGMTYVRGILQLYMMAASVMAFGPTEWALRLPSAVCGLLLIVACFFLGRRFLAPLWNLVFVAVVTISSTMILDAQEARMYVFMVTSLVWFNVMVFRWERTGHARDLVWAVIAMALAIQFHSLAVFGALLLFFPGVVHGDVRKLAAGAVAFVVSLVAFAVIHTWTESFFPPWEGLPAAAGAKEVAESRVYSRVALRLWPLSLLVLAFGVYGFNAVRRQVPDRTLAWIAAGCITAALCTQVFVLYHVAFLFMVVGFVAAARGGCRLRPFLVVLAVSALVLAIHLLVMHEYQPHSVRKLLGMLPGMPSVWPYFIFAKYAPLAAVIVVAGAAVALFHLAKRQQIADVWLYALLAVWAPIVLLGIFTWYIQQRYTELALVPLYLCSVASAQAFARALPHTRAGWGHALCAILALVMIGNPLATANVVNAGYRIHPDHKGAADYVRSVRGADDIVIAEDVLQQTYYLGRVDYWLTGERVAQKFTREVRGERLDIYTGTPVITSASALEEVIAKRKQNVFIIGSGEEQADRRRSVRGQSLAQLLEHAPWEVVYRGRDGLTDVWRVPPPQADAVANAPAASR